MAKTEKTRRRGIVATVVIGLIGLVAARFTLASVTYELYDAAKNVAINLMMPVVVAALGTSQPEPVEIETPTESIDVDAKVNEPAPATSASSLMSCLREDIAVRCQSNDGRFALNRFEVELTNNSVSPLSGQFHFSVVDVATGTIDLAFWGDPFTVFPHSHATLSYRYGGGFERSGVKKIVVDQHPRGFEATPSRKFVVPVEAGLTS